MPVDKNKLHVSQSLDTAAQLRLYRSIVESLPQGVFIKDPEGRYVLVNDYINKLLIPPNTQVIDRTDKEVFGDRLGSKVLAKDQSVWNQDGTMSFIEKVPINGKKYWFKTYKKIIPDPLNKKRRLLIGFPTDVSELKRTQAELEQKNTYLESLYNTTPDAVLIYDLMQQRIIDYNRVFTKEFGLEEERAEDFNLLGLIHPEERADLLRSYAELESKQVQNVISKVYRLRGKNKRYHWFRMYISYNHRAENSECFLFIAQNVDQIQRLQNKYKRLAEQDELTGLYNRRHFLKTLKQTITQGDPYTLLFVDLNDFKLVNDTYGHDCGDELLIQIAKRLQEIFRRKTDVVARMGGDEFVILMQGLLTATINREIPNRLRSQFSKPFAVAAHSIHSYPSIGAVTVVKPAKDSKKILKIADRAMYEAKSRRDLEFVWCSETNPSNYKIF